MNFDQAFFSKFDFEPKVIKSHLANALRDLAIARKDPFVEVRFAYSYQALVKAGIALIARVGGVKVRSVPGHHVKILQKMSGILQAPDIVTIGEAMRVKRNTDFYGGRELVGEKEAADYLRFVERIIGKIEKKVSV